MGWPVLPQGSVVNLLDDPRKLLIIRYFFRLSTMETYMRTRKLVKDRCYLNPDCSAFGQFGEGNIKLHSFYNTRQPIFMWIVKLCLAALDYSS
jgi:hypothetical protein